ncbi:acetyl-CoA carboxylase, biotin carboxyl carrier protein [Gloeothece citriformis PCC 7424]|uniref:Biotin carboxyl carrier protein of acetyl-CoA carboxylase n=1 Tax=Gloeothece citriformis (strain PCC 7424) TaxID=65393 RepID=B7KGU7_GLOC7|nr:acetyl-CoA carboxylase biotin carboxyl carrier protein [Gloeothece citriformis]ACK73434.1 acetyl-CoA carboxylase, biotin carboxyl carrier protein [Gloeothece citriformis PCC 7424]
MSINFNELRELLGTISQTDITELILKSEEFELTVRKGTATMPIMPLSEKPISEVVSPPVPEPSVQPVMTQTEPVTSEPTPPIIDKNWIPITSPMVGTFYRAPSPDEAPFVEVNDRIRSGQTVCIIEAMKLMNEIEAESAGQIMDIVVGNGESVEYGQTLMWLKPE